MSLKPAFAAVLRSVRGAQHRTQENLADAASRTYLGKLENGASSITLDKLDELADALNLSPLTLLALTLSARDSEPPQDRLERACEEVRLIEDSVGMQAIHAQLVGGKLTKRRPNRPADLEKLTLVLACKAEGLTQAATARKLGLNTSTVQFLWSRALPSTE